MATRNKTRKTATRNTDTPKPAVDIDLKSAEWGTAFARSYLEQFKRDPESVALDGFLYDASPEGDTEALEAFGKVIQAELQRLLAKEDGYLIDEAMEKLEIAEAISDLLAAWHSEGDTILSDKTLTVLTLHINRLIEDSREDISRDIEKAAQPAGVAQ